MKDLFQRVTTSILISSIIAFIIGLIMAVVPGLSLQVIGIMVGIFVILHGIVLIGLDFAINKIHIPFFGILSGVLSVIVGLILIAMPGVLSTVFTIALGIWIILSSVNIISMAVTVKNGVPNWFLLLLLGIVDLICGIIILFNPFASAISVTILGGIIIMIHSAVTIVDMIIEKEDVDTMITVLKEAMKSL